MTILYYEMNNKLAKRRISREINNLSTYFSWFFWFWFFLICSTEERRDILLSRSDSLRENIFSSLSLKFYDKTYHIEETSLTTITRTKKKNGVTTKCLCSSSFCFYEYTNYKESKLNNKSYEQSSLQQIGILQLK